MKVIWLGQGGLLFQKDDFSVLIDPYLSHSVEAINPQNKRRFPVDESFFLFTPDVLIFTHDHMDHFDPESASRFLKKRDKKILVLSPSSVHAKAKAFGEHNYVEFNPATEWSTSKIRFTAVRAVHSDPKAIGVILEDLTDGKNYYVTGDTLYSKEILDSIEKEIYAVFLPINGAGNNMNAVDAARFAEKLGAKKAVPIHFGLFDAIAPETYERKNRVIPNAYKEMDLS